MQLSVAKQRSLCLLSIHQTCATYLAAVESTEPGASPAGLDVDPALWPETRSTPLVLEPAHGLPIQLSGVPARTGGQALLVGLMVLAFIVLVVARTTAPPASGSQSPHASAGGQFASPSSIGSPVPSAGVTPTYSVSPVPSRSPSPAPSASHSASPSPSPSPSPVASVQRYTVRSGDTLSAIAGRFGTTVKAIKAANNLTSSVIRPGQVLVIP